MRYLTLILTSVLGLTIGWLVMHPTPSPDCTASSLGSLLDRAEKLK